MRFEVKVSEEGQWVREFVVEGQLNERRLTVHADATVEKNAPCVGVRFVSGDKKTSTGTSLPAVSPKHARRLAMALLQAADYVESLID